MAERGWQPPGLLYCVSSGYAASLLPCGLSPAVAQVLLIVVAPLAVKHTRLGSQGQGLTGLVALQHGESSGTRDRALSATLAGGLSSAEPQGSPGLFQ